MMLLLTTIVTLFGISDAFRWYAYEQDVDIAESGVSMEIIDEGNSELVQLTIEGPSDVWFGVGFGSNKMYKTYAIITYKDLLPIWNVEEYILGNHSRGDKLRNTTLKILETTTIDNGKRVRVKMERKRVDNTTTYDFPVLSQYRSQCPFPEDIISAKGVERDYKMATSMAPNSSIARSTCGSNLDSNLDSNDVTHVEKECTFSDTSECCFTCYDTEGCSSSDCISDVNCQNCDRAPCFDSNSYVLTYPNYERKRIDSLQIYDKILTYDELNDDYIWDELLVKIHCEKGEYLNDILVPMIEFKFKNNKTLTMTDKHLLYIFDEENNGNLYRADKVKIGDKMKQMNGKLIQVISIKNVFKYPRNLITYNANLVINDIAISSFPETIWGESKYWGQSLRFIAKYFHSYNIWRYPIFYITKIWNQYISVDLKQSILEFYFNQNQENKQDTTT